MRTPQRTFAGVYRDGTSSKSHACGVIVTDTGLRIVGIAEGAPEEAAFLLAEWQAAEIVKVGIDRNGIVELRYGSFPHETVQVQDPDFLRTARKVFGGGFLSDGIHEQALRTKKRIVAVMVAALAALAAAYFIGVPLLADAAALLLPKEREKELGSGLFSRVTADYEVAPEQEAAIVEFARSLDLGPPGPVVRVFQGDEVNAFAVMGGYIGVFTPMLEVVQTPDELAALLAHEWAHIELRHSVRLIFRSLSSYFVISVLAGDFTGMTAVLLQNADTLNVLRYSRKFEEEADEYGAQILAKKGFDPRAMADLLGRIQESDVKVGFEWLSTHPLTQERIARLAALSATGAVAGERNQEAKTLFEKIKKVYGENLDRSR